MLPAGFRSSSVHCGIKREAGREDLTLIVSDRPATAAGLYTQNLISAAPVHWDRSITPSGDVRVVLINSGNANACTGQQGWRDAEEMARLAAATVAAEARQALVMSTGIIGEFLPMDCLRRGVPLAFERLEAGPESALRAARGIMTTDSVPKLSLRRIETGGGHVQITGIAKGAGMIGPRMATMLATILTDARLDPETAQSLLTDVVEQTFNCISVEGHTSTNDTVLLLANGAAEQPEVDPERLRAGLLEVCTELAKAIPTDGEGATHLLQIDVRGCRDREEARKVARTIADSPLVKTAMAGADPNWGRIVSAAGYAGVPFDPADVSLKLNGQLLFRDGAPVPFDAEAVSAGIRAAVEVSIELVLGAGEGSCRFWSSDMTEQYIKINADYHT